MCCDGALPRTRTGTPVKARDFESLVSTIPPEGPHCAYYASRVTVSTMKDLYAKAVQSICTLICTQNYYNDYSY